MYETILQINSGNVSRHISLFVAACLEWGNKYKQSLIKNNYLVVLLFFRTSLTPSKRIRNMAMNSSNKHHFEAIFFVCFDAKYVTTRYNGYFAFPNFCDPFFDKIEKMQFCKIWIQWMFPKFQNSFYYVTEFVSFYFFWSSGSNCIPNLF